MFPREGDVVNLDEVLVATKQADIRLQAEGDRLVVDAPVGTLTPELRDALTRNKAALLARLQPVMEFICLKGGLIVLRPALELALDLEQRGFTLSLDPTERLEIEPTASSGPLTDADRAGIARWHLHLAAIVAYQVPVLT